MIKLKNILLILGIMFFSCVSPVFAQGEDPDFPTYIIQSGDTLSLIALRFGVSLDRLVEVNNIEDQNSISPGTELIIPDFPGVSGVLELRTIDFGETLHNLSIQFKIPVDQLVKLNSLTNPSEVVVGINLIVPQKEKILAGQIQLISNQPLLEEALLLGQNPWKLSLDNQLQGTWDAFPGDSLFITTAGEEDPEMSSSFASSLINSFSVSPLPLIQGQTTLIKISTSQPMTLTGSLAGSNLHFFETVENEYVALQGINGRQDPGVYSFSLEGTTQENQVLKFQQNVLIESGYFGNDPAITVDPITIDPAVTEPEQEFIESIVNQVSSQKYWDGTLSYPVDEPCIGAYYGGSRVYNGTYHYYHTGVDFPVCTANNINIYAAAPGVVVYTGELVVHGNIVFIDHGWGVFTAYCHQSEILVKEGDVVDTYQLIGKIGNTGRSTGPHLHFEVWVNGNAVNPMEWLLNSYP